MSIRKLYQFKETVILRLKMCHLNTNYVTGDFVRLVLYMDNLFTKRFDWLSNASVLHSELCTPDFMFKYVNNQFIEWVVTFNSFLLVNGGWDTWTNWSDCLSNIRSRTRQCANPVPKHGGSDCAGNGSENRYCRHLPSNYDVCVFLLNEDILKVIRLVKRIPYRRKNIVLTS